MIYAIRIPKAVRLAELPTLGQPRHAALTQAARCALCGAGAAILYRNPDVCREVPLCASCQTRAEAAWRSPYARINDRLAKLTYGYQYNRKKARRNR